MVAQIKDAWEAGARPVVVSPGAVLSLRPHKLVDTALQPVALIFGGHQTRERPPRLRRRARTLPLGPRIVVASGRFAPPTILVLNRAQPAAGRLISRLHHV